MVLAGLDEENLLGCGCWLVLNRPLSLLSYTNQEDPTYTWKDLPAC